MAEITLKDGDFGGDVSVTVGEEALYLPDKARPGLNEMVPLTAIAEIEALSDDRSGQLKHAAKLGVRGFLTTGNPLGLAAGVLAVTKVKDVRILRAPEGQPPLRGDGRCGHPGQSSRRQPHGAGLVGRGSRGASACRCGHRQVSQARRDAGAPAGGGSAGRDPGPAASGRERTGRGRR